MGNILKRKQRTKVICIGLDNSGKSTIINTLKPAKHKKVKPAKSQNIKLTKRQTGEFYHIFGMTSDF